MFLNIEIIQFSLPLYELFRILKLFSVLFIIFFFLSVHLFLFVSLIKKIDEKFLLLVCVREYIYLYMLVYSCVCVCMWFMCCAPVKFFIFLFPLFPFQSFIYIKLHQLDRFLFSFIYKDFFCWYYTNTYIHAHVSCLPVHIELNSILHLNKTLFRSEKIIRGLWSFWCIILCV